MQTIEPGAIGALMMDLPGNFEGRLWRVERFTAETATRRAMIAVTALDIADGELQLPSWYVPAERFWCLLDAGVVSI